MYLATRWFGRRAASLPSCLQEAAGLGFRGVAMLPESPAPEGTPGRSGSGLPAVGAVAWDAARGTGSGGGAAAQSAASSGGWGTAQGAASSGGWVAARAEVDAVLRVLHRLDARLLIVPAGEDADPERRARGRRLLGRLQAEGQLATDDEALATARAGVPLLRERQLEELAALLHTLARRAPGLQVAVQPHPSPAGLLDPAGFGLLAEALGDATPWLWHDTGVAECRAAAGLEAPGAWLDAWGGRIAGVTLQDWAAGQGQLPPGAGCVDWSLLREYLPRQLIRVLDLAPSYPGAVLCEARASLAALQIA